MIHKPTFWLQATTKTRVISVKNLALQVSSIRADDGLFFELLIPDFADPNDQDLRPSVRRVPLQLPPDATLGALRAAALRCGGGTGNWWVDLVTSLPIHPKLPVPGEHFGRVCPRIFCKGRFLSGSDRTPLASLKLGDSPLQCLPSNLVSRVA